MNLPQGRKPISKKEIIAMMPANEQPQYVIVTTIQTFKHKYAVPVSACRTEDPRIGAMDEVTMQSVREMGQEWLGETIVDAQTVPLSLALDQFDELSPYLKTWSHSQKVAYLNNWQEKEDV
jgi:hypothetical protein